MKLEKHFTATTWILSQEESTCLFLLVFHQKFQKWIPPGGHQEPFENFYEAALREVEEETGVSIQDDFSEKPRRIDDRAINLPLPYCIWEEKVDAHGDQPAHLHLDMIYVAHIPATKKERFETQQGSETCKWFTLQEIETIPTFENVRILARELHSKK